MFKLNLNKFFSPDDNNSPAIESGKMSTLDMAEFLGKEDETPDLSLEMDETPETGAKDKEKDDEEDDEEEGKEKTIEDELEEELAEPEVDDEEVVISVPRKAVLAKYPNIFKEFPHLDKAVYREQKYSELLPTLADARTAVEKAETLDEYSQELAQGNISNLLKVVKDEDPDAFYTIADNYLDNLKAADTNAYFHVLGNVIKHAISSMHNSGDDDNKIAAALINKYFFNSDKFDPPTNLSKKPVGEKNEKEEGIEKREAEFRERQLNTYVTQVNKSIHNIVTSAIDKNLDPKGSMDDYRKSKAMDDCAEALSNAIKQDTRFTKLLDQLWEKAAGNDFSQESLDRIRSAYWSKAKGLLPDIIRKTRNTALKGLGHRSPNERTAHLPVGTPANKRERNTSPRVNSGSSDKEKAQAIPKNVRSLDFLMRD